MTGLVIGAFVGLPITFGAIAIGFGKLDDIMQRKSAIWQKFFGWDAESEDDKKAPAAATAGTQNFINHIYTTRITQVREFRKAAK